MPLRLLSVVALLVVFGFWLSSSNEDAGDDASPSTPSAAVAPATSAPSSERIDPSPYRAAIQAADAIAYSSAPADWGTADRAGEAIAAVGRQVLRGTRDPRDRRRAQSLLALGQRIGATSDVGYAMPDRKKIRDQWEDTRNAVFEPSGWFRGNLAAAEDATADAAKRAAATRELDRTQRPSAPESITRSQRATYERLIADLERASARGRRACRELGEPDYDISVRSTSSATHVARWDAWAVRWREDLDDVWSDVPSAPSFSAPLELLRAHQNVTKAFEQLQLVPRGSGQWPTPFEAQWIQRFDRSESLLDQAKSDLAAVRVAR